MNIKKIKHLSKRFIIVSISFTIFSIIGLWIFYPTPHRFIITSYGGSGTTWLYKNISSIPSIVCTDYIANINREKGRLKSSIKELISLQQYFSNIDYFKLYPIKALGNIHGFSYAFIANEAKYTKNLTVINLIRHPISRMHSIHQTNVQIASNRARVFKNAKLPSKKNITRMQKKYYDKIVEKYGANVFLNYKSILFLDALVQQDRAYKDMQMCINDNILQIRFEDITKQPHLLIDLISKITSEKVILSEAKANQMINAPAINKHHPSTLSIEQKYLKWPAWKKYAFQLHLQNGNKRQLYESLGYSLDFVEND